jgi:hypothetical protein
MAAPECPRLRRRQAGFSLLWCVVLIALVGAALLCLTTLDPQMQIPTHALAACVAVAGVGLVVAARRDFHGTCLRAGVLALGAAAGCVAVAAGTDTPSLAPTAGAVGFALGGGACLLAAWRDVRGEDPLRNLLLEEFERAEVREIDGVQFALSQSDREVLAGEELNVHLLVQNGTDAERRFEVRLRPRPDVGRGGHLEVDKQLRVDLPPGAAAAIAYPIAVQPRAKGSYAVRVEAGVTGERGTRIRRWRAKPYQRPASPLEQLGSLLLGGFVWGGGMHVELRVRRGDLPLDATCPASPASAELVYLPEPGLVRGFALTR